MNKFSAILPVMMIAFICLAGSTVNEKGIEYYPADGVYPLNNRDYAPNVINLFRQAQKSIHIFLLEGGYYPNFATGVNNQLYNAMFEAVQRGVEVQIVLDQAGYNPSQSLRNLELGEYLRSGGVDVYYDDPETTVHSKTLIVDSLYTIVGSTNWSYWALDKNNESSVLIKSAEVALEYEQYFADIMSQSFPKMTVIE